jgi:antitoxin component YwqK of YwqJK toxin-antitoxin module
MKKITFIIFLFFFQSSFAQDSQKAVEFSKSTLNLIKTESYLELMNSFEDTIKKNLSIELIKMNVGPWLKILDTTTVDFENYKLDFVVPFYDDSTLAYFRYRFPLGNAINERDYFETYFLVSSNFNKIFGVNLVKIERMPEVNVTVGAEHEEIPSVGQVITKNNEQTGFIEKIKYRDFHHLIIIDFDAKQNKISETILPLDNLKYKTLTNYTKKGTIEYIASYNNGIVIDEFREFYPNGFLKEIGVYREGFKKDGEWKYFDEGGNLIKTVFYNDGELINKLEE